MGARLKAAMLVLAGLLLGSIGGVVLIPMISNFLAPASHKAIIGAMKITTEGWNLTSTYLSTGKTTWQLSLADNFEYGGTYTYSLWVYSYQGDPEVYVCIWGPGKDGKTHMVELSSASGKLYTVKYGATVKDFTDKTVLEIVVVS